MTKTALILAAAFSFAASSAFADCPPKSTSNADGQQTGSISKDGSRAPLQTTDTKQPVAKDGKTMPLATEEGGGNKDLATSQQDVEAQQQGDKTAAAAADENCKVQPN